MDYEYIYGVQCDNKDCYACATQRYNCKRLDELDRLDENKTRSSKMKDKQMSTDSIKKVLDSIKPNTIYYVRFVNKPQNLMNAYTIDKNSDGMYDIWATGTGCISGGGNIFPKSLEDFYYIEESRL